MRHFYLLNRSLNQRKAKLVSEVANTNINEIVSIFFLPDHIASRELGLCNDFRMQDRLNPTKKFIIWPENIAEIAIIW